VNNFSTKYSKPIIINTIRVIEEKDANIENRENAVFAMRR
jgi:hypothetical protein